MESERLEMDVEVPSEYSMNDTKKLRQVENILNCLILTKKETDKIRKIFIEEMNNGLREEPSSLQMENTYIENLPDGTEEGKFLSLDLGGTNFRILLTTFRGGEVTETTVQHYEISQELRLGSGTDLFDHVADCVCHFINEKQLTDNKISLGEYAKCHLCCPGTCQSSNRWIPRTVQQRNNQKWPASVTRLVLLSGFTFSFPITHHSLRSGFLVNWTKSFKCMDVVGKDVVQLLNKSLLKKGCYNVNIKAILNDTTGTLVMGALIDKKTSIGLIIGTGSNACYTEKSERVKYWETNSHLGNEVIINIEWGAFGDNGVIDFVKTEFDVQVDENSLLVKSFTFEKYISGKYLGELVRVILVKLVKEGVLFGGRFSKELLTAHKFSSAYISHIEEDMLNGTMTGTRQVLEVLNIPNWSEEDVGLIRYVCRLVTNRSALLVAICLSVLLDRMDKKEVTIAVDGSVYEKHPTYRFTLEKYLRQMTKKKFKFLRVSDGSGKGAAVVVAISNK
ncbi:hypothetical protein RUM43_001393 [Polyplax serrata]|uniref:Phosphotransferase n=1 Tax=Polyplax serrata TaxID=468196 RepID=A0AAN8XTU2_POLSC